MNKLDWQEDLALSTQSKRTGFGFAPKSKRSLDVRIRVRIVWSVFVVAMALLLSKIIYLQVVAGGQYQLSSYSNHVEVVRQGAPRGIVYDRNGVALTLNREAEGVIQREYPHKEAIAPVLGYLSEVTPSEIGCFDGLCYILGTKTGRTGIEKVMEARLRGRDGGRLIEVDASGNEVRELGRNLAEPGSDVWLSLDIRLQEMMYEAMREHTGSAVALDMQGKVLGMVSSPSYDPNRVSEYLGKTDKLYFLNRAIAGTYPPGSVFKLVTSIAGLEEGVIDESTVYEDTGEIKIGDYRYGNWYFDQYGRTEGSVTLVNALSRSNDIYFYKMGESLGVDKLVEWADKFGLGQKSGIELPGEQAGLLPNRLWKERATGEKWFLGNTYHLSIGQGDLLSTPLQVARMTAGTISGRMCQASLLKDVTTKCENLGVESKHLELVSEGMKAACAAGGTAFPFFNFSPWVLCKTGTAQHGGQVKEGDLPHAWIAVGYPGDNPEMILVVMVESGGEGSAVAGGIAQQILSEWSKVGAGRGD